MITVRAARRSRWRLVGGRLSVDAAGVRFVPNRLERRRGAGDWFCPIADVGGVGRRGRFWLVVETTAGAEVFRVFGAGAAMTKVGDALPLAVPAHPLG
jgi:hypothetical protein